MHLALSQNAATLRESARGLLHHRGRRGRPPGRRRPRASRSTCGTSPPASARRSSRTSSRSTPPAARRTPASAATSGSSSPPCWTRRSPSASTRWQPATTPRSSSGRMAGASCTAPSTRSKDQSYVLGVLDEDQLARSFFPLGDTTKPQIREEAEARGFFVASKPDSHDICFIPDGDTRGFLSRALGEQPGELVDTEGKVVGSHSGAYGFTVGQRRGLGPRPRRSGRRTSLRRRRRGAHQHRRHRYPRPPRRRRDRRRPRALVRSRARGRRGGRCPAAGPR